MNEYDSSTAYPCRARPVHHVPVEPHGQPVIIFLTVCTKNRRPVLASPDTHLLIREVWSGASHWSVGRYMVMPDHLHLFCSPGTIPPRALKNWVSYWKSELSRLVGAQEGSFWQKDFWDTQIRHRESYAAKWEYVRNNPVRAGLVPKTADWPYQGELNSLRWRE